MDLSDEGDPGLKTVRAQASGLNNERADVHYGGGTGANTYVWDVSAGRRSSNKDPISIHVSMHICVEDDTLQQQLWRFL